MNPAMTAYIEANEPLTALQAANDLSITRTAFYAHHKAGSMHIEGWTRGANGHAVALYVLGAGRDAKKPESMTQAERGKAYWQRHRAMIRARRPSKTMINLGIWGGLK